MCLDSTLVAEILEVRPKVRMTVALSSEQLSQSIASCHHPNEMLNYVSWDDKIDKPAESDENFGLVVASEMD